MATMADLVTKTRSMLGGGIGATMARTAAPYNPGDSTITLQTAQRISAGSLISVGLNTFYVTGVTQDALTFQVIAGADGGPDEAFLSNSIALIKPRQTNWRIFQELHDAIVDLASPRSGVFWAASFEADVRYSDFVYPLPELWWESDQQPIKLLRTRYRRGTGSGNDWQDLSAAHWLPERYAVRLMFQPDDARKFEFTFAFPFIPPSTLDEDLFDLGLTEPSTQDLPPLRAAGRLALGVEGRRVQPYSQGDTRRPEEVPVTASLGVERDFLREYREGVMAEQSKLQALWAPRFAMGGRT